MNIVDLESRAIQNITFEVYDNADDISIHTKINDTELICRDSGYFTAFQKIRDEILKLGFGIKCNGSRLNAVQSGMMSGSERIYLVKSGIPAALNDIVNIFGYADISDFPDTAMQNDFTGKWFKSLGSV